MIIQQHISLLKTQKIIFMNFLWEMYAKIYQVNSFLVEIKLVLQKFHFRHNHNKFNFASPKNTLKALMLRTSLYE